MHLVLTDTLTCSFCGPEEGLIVLAERMENRRVLEGALGCPACRRQFPIRAGAADLRRETVTGRRGGAENAEPDWAHPTATGPTIDPMRLAALLALADGDGYTLLIGVQAECAAGLATFLPGREFITAAPLAGEEREGVNQLLVDAVLPLRTGSVSGVLLSADTPSALLQEALRVLAVGGRLVAARTLPGVEALADTHPLRMLTRAAEHFVFMRLH
jgi:hypothetical protein